MPLLVGSRRALLGSAGVVGWLPGQPARNGLLAALGDSITAAAAASDVIAQTVDSGGVGAYLTWACILPKTGDTESTGRVQWGKAYAQGGYTVSQILATYYPQLIAASPRPGMVAICAGANDLASMGTSGARATRVADVRTMAAGAMAAGIMPIICSPPANNNAGNANLPAFRDDLQALATSLGCPFVDFLTITAAPSDVVWNTNYNASGTDHAHPSVLGAVKMAQALRDAIDPYLPAAPTIATTITDDLASYLNKNGSFTDDGDADGVPDGGLVQATGYWVKTANGCAWTLAARSGYAGKAARWNKTSNPGTSEWLSPSVGGSIIQLTDGHQMTFGFRCEVAAWAASSFIDLTGYKLLDINTRMFELRLKTDTIYTDPVAPFVWTQQWTVPEGFDDADGGKTRFDIGLAGSASIDFYLGQWTVRDDTVAAIPVPASATATVGAAAATGVAATATASAGFQAGDFRAAATQVATVNSNVVVNKPAGTQDGDDLFAFISSNDATVNTVPTGWTLIQEQKETVGLNWIRCYYKRASSEPASWTWVYSASISHLTTCLAYANTTGAGATKDTGASAGSRAASTTTLACPSVTTAGANRLLLCAVSSTGFRSHTGPGGATNERFDSGSVNPSLAVYDEIVAAAGATGTRTITASSTCNMSGISAAFAK